MKLAGSHGSVAIVPRWNSRATLPGLLSPGDHTSGWTTNTLHSHLAWRYWFRWGCGASSTTSVIADLAGGHISYPRSTGPDHAALHPLRHDAPDQKGCNAYGSGAPPPTTSPTASTPSQHTTTGSIARSHTASKYSHRFRARAAAPDPSRCTRSEGVQCLRIGCAASHNKHNRGQFLPTDPNRQHRTPPHGLDMLTPAPNERRCTS